MAAARSTKDKQHATDEDKIATEASTSTSTPTAPSSTDAPKRPAKDAFAELMSKKARTLAVSPKKSTHVPSSASVYFGRDGLGAYTANPEAFSPSTIVSYDDDFVVIRDRFPKSSVHLLVLPRDKSKQLLHPFDAFQDATFLEKTRAEVSKVEAIVASELRRKYGRFSAQDAARNQAMEAEDPPDVLPSGRDWSASVMSGVHLHPSMNHLHVHVLSVDRYSECLKHRKHYNSFATPFLVPLEELPLAEGDKRKKERFLEWDMKCWRCGRNFGNKFARLKEHLAEEFENWKVE